MLESTGTEADRHAASAAWLDRYTSEVALRRDGLKRREARWSTTRLVTFAGGFVAWLAVPDPLLSWAALVAGGLLFVGSVRRHRQVRTAREGADGRVLAADEARQRSGGALVLIRGHERPADASETTAAATPIIDDGATWSLTDQELDDLDVYAPPVGLFGLLNRTSTALGARRLRAMIEHPLLDSDRILDRQEAVRWLEEHPERRLGMMGAASGLRGRDSYLERLVTAIRQAEALPWPGVSLAMRAWALVTATIILASVVGMARGYGGAWIVIGGLLLLNSVLCLRVRSTVARRLAPWRNVAVAATGYWQAARQAAEELPDEGVLGRLRGCFESAVERNALPSLCGRVGWADSGGMIHALFEALFFWDLHVLEAILRCVLRHRRELLDGLSAMADLEALHSLASLADEQPVRCYPRTTTDRSVELRGGRHPLIEPERIVANDCRLDTALPMWVITGSNMSGKSTFLRMVGANCLLAQMGAPAIAEEMTWSPVRLVTDLQVRDSLSRDESYFLAEVRHLRRMICPQGDAVPVLGLIDEPFRGTNSVEKVAASVALVEHLMASPHLFLVATHEQELTELVDGRTARNCHFRENLDKRGLVFDYRLHAGPARTRNALRVLEREGYPPGVVERARAWLRSAGLIGGGED